MAASREKQRTHRKKTMDSIKESVKLREPLSTESSAAKQKTKVPVKTKSALVQGEGRSMGMEID